MKPDGIIYDGSTKRVIVSNGSGSSTIIDAENVKAVGDIDLGGKPEFAAADGKAKVFVNLEDKNEIVRIDPVALKVEARWPLAPCEGPSALAMDRAGRRLFVGCHNNMMAVVNADTGAVVQTAPIGAHVDAAAFDKEAKTVFFSCGDGTVSVFQEETPESSWPGEPSPPNRAPRRPLSIRKRTICFSPSRSETARPFSRERSTLSSALASGLKLRQS